jgi:hypothetical protein
MAHVAQMYSWLAKMQQAQQAGAAGSALPAFLAPAAALNTHAVLPTPAAAAAGGLQAQPVPLNLYQRLLESSVAQVSGLKPARPSHVCCCATARALSSSASS